MADFTQDQVGKALANLGNYRVKRAQEVANTGFPDGISGSLLLALGLRETNLKNLEGGLKLVGGEWVKQDDPTKMDVGWTQINRGFHAASLKLMPGVKAGTWTPTVDNKTANDAGFVPRFEEALMFTVNMMHESQAYGADHGVPDADLARFSVAAHNGGMGGALKGFREGNMDKYTTMGDYSGWVLRHRTLINRWLGQHPNWKVDSTP
jgi:hypothetical protein